MTKRVRVKTRSGQSLWIITPNINVESFMNKKKGITFLEIFYAFAQKLLKPSKNVLSDKEKRQWEPGVRCTMIELNNKVVQLKFFAREMQRKEKELLSREDIKKKIYDYKPYQIFLALTEGYLNTLHSINDFIKQTDKALGKKYSKEMRGKPWFLLYMDLRNLFHHIESPSVTIIGKKIVFIFERTDELNFPPRFLSENMKDERGRYMIEVNCDYLIKEVLDSLNKWAEKYLNLLNKEETFEPITSFYKDGRLKSKKVTLGTLIKIANDS